jgi:hypothetical protein
MKEQTLVIMIAMGAATIGIAIGLMIAYMVIR